MKIYTKKVFFSEADLNRCGMIGVARNAAGWARGMNLGKEREDYGFETHINGALAEYAASVILRLPWCPVIGKLDKGGDLPGWGIKSATRMNDHLIVQKDELDTLQYGLVYVNPHFAMWLGWMHGAEAKNEDLYWTWAGSRPGCTKSSFWIPTTDLVRP